MPGGFAGTPVNPEGVAFYRELLAALRRARAVRVPRRGVCVPRCSRRIQGALTYVHASMRAAPCAPASE
jgi:hypothetical protein